MQLSTLLANQPGRQALHLLILQSGGLYPLLSIYIMQAQLHLVSASCHRPPLSGLPVFAPSSAATAGLPVFAPFSAATVDTAGLAATATTFHYSGPSSSIMPPATEGAAILSSALPPIGAKLAVKIRSGQFVGMKELLPDNMALHSQLDSLPGQVAVTARPHCLREIDYPLTWVFCFLTYIAVCTDDAATRDMLTYARLIIREAQSHGGLGWLEYDKWFRQQQAARTLQHPWNELNASLHASTVMSLRAGVNRACKFCRGT